MATRSRTKSRTTKAEQAQATRVRIVDAATRLFLTDGFVTTTMASIALEAGVVVQTLYLSFGNKTAILQATFDQALRGNVHEIDLVEQDWFARVLADPDGQAALRIWCESSTALISRAAPIFEVMRAASADPEVGELLARNKKLRYDGFKLIIGAIASRPGFAAELSLDDAHGIAYTVISEDSYLLLVTEHGWSPERWLAWVTSTCIREFFPDVSR